jgi:hypothetical protein
MGTVFRPFFADSDQLLLGGHVLSALEIGRMRMHAEDYFEISNWMVDVFDRLPLEVLLRLRREGPTPLRHIVENALHERGEVDWVADRRTRIRAEAEWRNLIGRVRRDTAN